MRVNVFIMNFRLGNEYFRGLIGLYLAFRNYNPMLISKSTHLHRRTYNTYFVSKMSNGE